MQYVKIPHKMAHILKPGTNETYCDMVAFCDTKYISEKKPRGLICAVCSLEAEEDTEAIGGGQ